jgi:D-ribose pyranose/furanose isomerase RbsD
VKRAGILNSDLSYLIATLGHTDLVGAPFANVLLWCGVAF